MESLHQSVSNMAEQDRSELEGLLAVERHKSQKLEKYNLQLKDEIEGLRGDYASAKTQAESAQSALMKIKQEWI